MTISKITSKQWFKVLKAFIYAGVSLGLAYIPVYFAHNAAYLSLSVPINALLVTLKQLITQQESTEPVALQNEAMHGVEELSTGITDDKGNLVVDPNAPR